MTFCHNVLTFGFDIRMNLMKGIEKISHQHFLKLVKMFNYVISTKIFVFSYFQRAKYANDQGNNRKKLTIRSEFSPKRNNRRNKK